MIAFALIHLEALIEIAQHGSFQAAADRLGVTQPTISMRVHDLESALGGPLFDRSGHRAVLTERGREALRYARQIVGLARELHGVSASEEAAGVVRIGAADTFALQQLPGLLAELERRYPRLRVDVTIDQYPYTASSTGVAALLPQWALEGGQKSTAERLAAPEQRARIKTVVVQNLKYDRGAGDPKNVVIVNCGFDRSLAGKSLADITRARGAEPTLENAAETAMDLVNKGGCSAVYHAISEEDVVRIMRSPYAMVASDGDIPVFGQAAPHPRSYGTFARVLGVYVREQKVIPLEEAVRKMSGYPAERLKLWDRGLLRPGMKADVVVFDPGKVGDRATYEQPHQYSVGFSEVIVNGKLALHEGKVTAERPGKVLLGPSAR